MKLIMIVQRKLTKEVHDVCELLPHTCSASGVSDRCWCPYIYVYMFVDKKILIVLYLD